MIEGQKKAEVYDTVIKNHKLYIPDKLKDCFADRDYVLTRGRRNAIYLCNQADWKAFEEILDSLPYMVDSKCRGVRSFFLGCARDTERKNNYIIIPENFCRQLCEYKRGEAIEVMLYFDREAFRKWVIKAPIE